MIGAFESEPKGHVTPKAIQHVTDVLYMFVGSPWHVSLGALAGIAMALVLPVTPAPETVVADEVSA
jgi:hypothetical protein